MSRSTQPQEIGTPAIDPNQPIPEPEINFFPYFKKEEECFKNERTSNGKQWPRQKPMEQKRYENWLMEVMNPVNGKYYLSQPDDKGKRETPQHIITSITRIKRRNGAEYLYSYGKLIGYNSFGDIKQSPADKPEKWQRTLFGSHLGTVNNRVQRISDGPIRSEIVYEIDFNEDNLRYLIDKRESDYVSFSVIQETSNRKYEVKNQATIEDTIQLFLKPFEYLHNAEYMPDSQKEQNRLMAEKQGLAEARANIEYKNQEQSTGKVKK